MAVEWHSQMGQDKDAWDYNNQRQNGFFVEVGAWDGIKFSNTFTLEHHHGWNGILIEPMAEYFTQLVQNRPTAQCSESLLWSESGVIKEFLVSSNCDPNDTTISMLSGIVDTLDRQRHSKWEHRLLKTKTLTEELDYWEAPYNIDYLSLDTEGSELEILKGLDFGRYRPNFISVEHNHKAGPRKAIGDYLTAKGYRFLRDNHCDDYYGLV